MLGGDDPDRLLLRFLRARKWDNEAAIEMFNNCIEWRLTFGANEIKEEDLPLSISTSGIMYFHQACKENRPIALDFLFSIFFFQTFFFQFFFLKKKMI